MPSRSNRRLIAGLGTLAAAILSVTMVASTAKPIAETKQATGGEAELILAIARADPAAGEAAAGICLACHTVGAGEDGRIGPNLYDIVGAPVARQEGFAYSPAMAALNAAGETWTFARLDMFLADPAAAVPGTRMGFLGIRDAALRAEVLAYLRTLSEMPVALAPVGGGDGLAPLTIAAEQAEAGARLYRRAGCVNCHGGALHGVVDTREDGEGDGPALIGARFVQRWFGGTVGDFVDAVRSSMPPDAPGALADADYVAIVAFILSENGFAAGAIALPADNATLAGMGFFQ